MENYATKNIRNIVLLGHSGSGKTSLVEAMLYLTKNTDRLGTISAGNTCSDYDPEEVKRGFSISASIAPLEWKKTKLNILDTPGYFDFEGEVHQCVRAADAAVIVVDGKSGVQVGTELSWDVATSAGIPKAFFMNRFDDPEAKFHRVLDALREKFGVSVCPVQFPIRDANNNICGFANLIEDVVYSYDPKTNSYVKSPIPAEHAEMVAKYRNMLLESVAQTSEELMEKFFAEEEITTEEALAAMHDGIMSGEIVPVFAGAASKIWGLYTLLDT